jgi:hypothetical protein
MLTPEVAEEMEFFVGGSVSTRTQVMLFSPLPFVNTSAV